MKQLNLFGGSEEGDGDAKSPKEPKSAAEQKVSDADKDNKKNNKEEAVNSVHWKLFIDGASRNNPGPAGAGFYLLKDSKRFAKNGYYLGIKTNNQAEYLALLIGLNFLKAHVKPGDCVHVVSDSQLVVRQLKGEYKVKAPDLKPLFMLARKMVQSLGAELLHVLRIDNVQADKMANEGVDTKRAVPDEFIKVLTHHGISI